MPNHLTPGKTLKSNCYCIIEVIGQGGFGITYLAEEIGYLKNTGFDEDFEYITVASPRKGSHQRIVLSGHLLPR